MKIRQEIKEDYNTIYELIKTAFETAKVSAGTEQDFAVMLRNSNGFIPELALVAEVDNSLVGHIMLTKTYIACSDSKYETLLLGPISVKLEYRNHGVGAKLITHSLKLARKFGYESVVLVGNPNYYNKFGFKTSTNFGIKNSNKIPDEFVLACELIPDALEKINGEIYFETI